MSEKTKYSEAELSTALNQYWEAHVKSISALAKDEHVFSDKFEKNMNKLIKREKKVYYPLIKTKRRIAVLVAVITFLVMMTTALAFEPIRKKLFSFIVSVFPDSSEVVTESTANTPQTVNSKYVPSYLPSGYVFNEENATENDVGTFYIDKQSGKEIFIDQTTLPMFKALVNTQDIETINITLNNGMKGFYYTNKGEITFVVADNEYAFLISGSESLEEIEKVAGSLNKK